MKSSWSSLRSAVVLVSVFTPLVARCGILLVGVSNCNKRGRWYGEGEDGVTAVFRFLIVDQDIMIVVVLVVVV
jgi:hypothetical protein